MTLETPEVPQATLASAAFGCLSDSCVPQATLASAAFGCLSDSCVPQELYDDLDAYFGARLADWSKDRRDANGRIPSRSKQMRAMGWDELELYCAALVSHIRKTHDVRLR